MDNWLLECQHINHRTTTLNSSVNYRAQSKRLKAQELIRLNTNIVTCGCHLGNSEHILKLKKKKKNLFKAVRRMTSVEYHWVISFRPFSPPPFSTPEQSLGEYRLQCAQHTDSSTATLQSTRSSWYRRTTQELPQPGLRLGVLDGAYPGRDQNHTSGWAGKCNSCDLPQSHLWAVNLWQLLETARCYSHQVLHSAASWEGNT